MYAIYAYLGLFRLEELGFPNFKCASVPLPPLSPSPPPPPTSTHPHVASKRASERRYNGACRKLVACQDAQKMIVFLRYLFSEKNLKSYSRDEWIKVPPPAPSIPPCLHRRRRHHGHHTLSHKLTHTHTRPSQHRASPGSAMLKAHPPIPLPPLPLSA